MFQLQKLYLQKIFTLQFSYLKQITKNDLKILGEKKFFFLKHIFFIAY